MCEGEARLLCRGEVNTSMVALCLLAQETRAPDWHQSESLVRVCVCKGVRIQINVIVVIISLLSLLLLLLCNKEM